VLRGVWQEFTAGNILDVAAQLSYYFLYSLFPLLFFLISLAAYLPPGLAQAADEALDRLRQLMPPQAASIVEEHVRGLLTRERPQLLSLGLLVTVWSASRAVDAFRRALNVAYDVSESRSFLRVQLNAVLMLVVATLFILLSIAAILLGGEVGFWLAERVHFGRQFLVLWSWLRWPISAVAISLTAALLYYVLPDVKQDFVYITPGSVLSTVLWLLCTLGFTVYVERFGDYNATYGSIGGVIVLMTWLYLSGLVFLLGGKVNALIEHESAVGKARGARAEGEAPLPAEERPSAGRDRVPNPA
jgi:membrane protein